MTTYVLTLKTWEEWDRPHHWYGRIHWLDAEEVPRCDDSLAEPDAKGFETIRHDSKDSAVAGARRWFAAHAKPGDRLMNGTWALDGLAEHLPIEVLEIWQDPAPDS